MIKLFACLFSLVLPLPDIQWSASRQQPPQNGAWQRQEGNRIERVLLQDGYFIYSVFHNNPASFEYTWGGPVIQNGSQLEITIQFNTRQPGAAGSTVTLQGNLQNNTMAPEAGKATESWQRLDDGDAPLSGVWRISGRMQQGSISNMPLRARRTLKLLTGTCFQWTAINIETGEFFGTGGGHYDFANGKYTEKIEYFSRDNSRVGQSLSFEGKLEDGQWHHSGLSSRGDNIYEIWSKMTDN